MRMVCVAGADPVGTVLDPVTEVDRLRRLEEVSRGTPPHRLRGAWREADLQRARTPQEVLHRAEGYPCIVVLATLAERGIVEVLLEQQHSLAERRVDVVRSTAAL